MKTKMLNEVLKGKCLVGSWLYESNCHTYFRLLLAAMTPGNSVGQGLSGRKLHGFFLLFSFLFKTTRLLVHWLFTGRVSGGKTAPGQGRAF